MEEERTASSSAASVTVKTLFEVSGIGERSLNMAYCTGQYHQEVSARPWCTEQDIYICSDSESGALADA